MPSIDWVAHGHQQRSGGFPAQALVAQALLQVMQAVYAPVPLATIKKRGAQVVAQLLAQGGARCFGDLRIGM